MQLSGAMPYSLPHRHPAGPARLHRAGENSCVCKVAKATSVPTVRRAVEHWFDEQQAPYAEDRHHDHNQPQNDELASIRPEQRSYPTRRPTRCGAAQGKGLRYRLRGRRPARRLVVDGSGRIRATPRLDSRRHVYTHEQLMRPFPKRFERDRLLGGLHRELMSSPLSVAFAEHTQRPQKYLAQPVAHTIDPPPVRVRKERTHSYRPGMLRECYRPRGIAFAQHLLRGLHRGAGTLDIDHHVGWQMELVGTEAARRRRVFRQPCDG